MTDKKENNSQEQPHKRKMTLAEAVSSFRLDEVEHGDTESAMFKLGYRGMTEQDCRLFRHLGKEIYDKIIEGTFRYSLIEARYLGLETIGEGFKKMCNINRLVSVSAICEQLPFLYGRFIDFHAISDREMLMSIMSKYNKREETPRFKAEIRPDNPQRNFNSNTDLPGDEWKYA